MKQIGAAEAGGRIGELIDWVEAGEQVDITRDGRVVARLVSPAAPAADVARSLAAAERIRAMRKGMTLGGLTIRELIDEGRR